MKGLLLKDWALMKSQKTFYGLMLAFGVLYSYMLEEPTFVIGYIIIICSISTLNSLAYDEHDNGTAYLFTFPFSRAEYVKEKYLFGILSIGISTLVISSICGIVFSLKEGNLGQDFPIIVFSIFIIGVLLMSLNLPIHLKFGAEKGKIILIVVTIGICAFFYVFADVLNVMDGVVKWLEDISVPVVVGGMLMIGAAGVWISMRIAIAIIRKKEF